MARYSVYQQIKTFTVPREGFLERVVYNTKLDKKTASCYAILDV